MLPSAQTCTSTRPPHPNEPRPPCEQDGLISGLRHQPSRARLPFAREAAVNGTGVSKVPGLEGERSDDAQSIEELVLLPLWKRIIKEGSK